LLGAPTAMRRARGVAWFPLRFFARHARFRT
jgi:hypothetical protein